MIFNYGLIACDKCIYSDKKSESSIYEFIILYFSNNHIKICTVVIFSLLVFIYKDLIQCAYNKKTFTL